jgi:hypothetical protein
VGCSRHGHDGGGGDDLEEHVYFLLLCGSSIRQLRAEERARRTHYGYLQSSDREWRKREELIKKKAAGLIV